MGDRANVVIYEPQEGADPHEAVFLYGHWSGSELPQDLKRALVRGVERWTDPQYFARIVFQQMIGNDKGITGFGITTRLGDNEYPLLVCEMRNLFVTEYPEDVYREHGFAKLDDYKGIPFGQYDGKWERER